MKTTTATASEKFVPEIGKIYHLHVPVAGADECFNGRVIGLTSQWLIIENKHGQEQALPIAQIEYAQEITEESQEEKQARLSAIQTLFPGMPPEMAAELADLLTSVQSMNIADIELTLSNLGVRH